MSDRKVQYKFDPLDGIRVSEDERDQILDDVADYVKESILYWVAVGQSPVTGKPFKKLSKAYKKKKEAEGGDPIPNLELTGALLDGLEVVRRGNQLVATVSDDQQPKADGHCNFSGKSKLPRRPFIPDEKEGETFSKFVEEGIRNMVNYHLADTEEQDTA